MTPDQIGRLAEAISVAHFERAVGPPFGRPLFRAVRLGDKYPTADLLVDVLDPEDRPTGFFFVQVKGTTTASRTAPRITIDVPVEQFNRLVRLPAPAYLLAVDVAAELVYLRAVCRPRKTAVASVTKAFPLADDAVRMRLYREVCSFWAARRRPRHTSEFDDD
jgi:hypothetical protein